MKSLNFDKIEARIASIPESFDDKVAQMGWFDSARYPDGTPVAYVATIQEKGAPAVGIPPRATIKPTIENRKTEWVKLLASGVKAVAEGRATADDVLEGVGLQAAGDMRKSIAEINSPPLSPTTILLRKWRREGRTITGKTVGEAAAAVAADPSLIAGENAKPLNDTGLLVATLTNAVGKA